MWRRSERAPARTAAPRPRVRSTRRPRRSSPTSHRPPAPAATASGSPRAAAAPGSGTRPSPAASATAAVAAGPSARSPPDSPLPLPIFYIFRRNLSYPADPTASTPASTRTRIADIPRGVPAQYPVISASSLRRCCVRRKAASLDCRSPRGRRRTTKRQIRA